jgi:tetratricopeptide (TPR) repeat protein
MKRGWLWLACSVFGLAASTVAMAEVESGESVCGSLDNGNAGPYDYRDPGRAAMLGNVNTNHYNADVQNLVRGETGYQVIGDLDFVLRAFPNHHQALSTMMRYFLQGGDRSRFRSAECYFDRAIRLAPDDVYVRQIFSVYLARKQKMPDAIDQLERAIALSPEPMMELHYNLGLLYTDSKDFDKANLNASIAYGMGHPLPGLRDKLMRLGQWRPVQVTSPAPSSPEAQMRAAPPRAEPGAQPSGIPP